MKQSKKKNKKKKASKPKKKKRQRSSKNSADEDSITSESSSSSDEESSGSFSSENKFGKRHEDWARTIMEDLREEWKLEDGELYVTKEAQDTLFEKV